MPLAQVNVARFRFPLPDPRMADFVAQIDEINGLAEASPGFIWRYQGDFDGARFPAPYDDPLLFFNMSVWSNADALRAFVVSPRHRDLMKNRSLWTEPLGGPSQATWSVAEDERPTTAEGIAALRKAV